MNAATIAIRIIMTSDNQPPRTPLRKNHHSPTDSDIMHAYAIDTLFDPSYHTTDTEEIETKDALRAPEDKEQFIAAIRLEIDSLINITKVLVPIHRNHAGDFTTNTSNKRTFKNKYHQQ